MTDEAQGCLLGGHAVVAVLGDYHMVSTAMTKEYHEERVNHD